MAEVSAIPKFKFAETGEKVSFKKIEKENKKEHRCPYCLSMYRAGDVLFRASEDYSGDDISGARNEAEKAEMEKFKRGTDEILAKRWKERGWELNDITETDDGYVQIKDSSKEPVSKGWNTPFCAPVILSIHTTRTDSL